MRFARVSGKVAEPSSGASPVRLAVQGERVFALALRSLACLEYASGRVLWQVEVESAVSGSLLVDGGRVLVAGAGKVAAYDAMDGRELWQQPFKGEGFGPVSLALRGATVQADVGGY
jgi:outer membrane protein assembly factor BamB